MSQLRTVQVLGGGSAGSSAHVGSLTAGLVARGVRVTVCAPPAVDRAYDFTATGARFLPVPRRSDPAAVAALRAACTGADVVHAHGLHAAARTALALSGRAMPLVMTWHTRRYAEGARRQILHLLERRAARAAAVVLAPSSDLVDRARERGARDARLAPVTVPPARSDGTGGEGKARAELGSVDRPLLMAVGSLVPHHGFDVLLDAARVWRGLDPVPLLVIAGRGATGTHCNGGSGTSGCPSRSSDAGTVWGSCSPPPIWPCCRAGGAAPCWRRRRCAPGCRSSPPPSAACPN